VGEQVFTEHLQRLDVYVRERGRWRLQSMTAVRPPEAPAVVAMSVSALAAYAGTYEFGPGIVSTVAREGDHLIEQTTGNPPGPLLPVGPDTFYAPSDLEGRVVFTRDANGRVNAQLYRSGSQEVRGRRTD
jgi:hypothetical protein